MAMKVNARKILSKRKYKPRFKKQLVTKAYVDKAISLHTERRIDRDTNSISFSTWSASNVSFDHVGFALGDGDGNRVGQSIKITSMRFHGSVIAADAYNVVRLIAFQWHSNSSTTPVLDDIFDNSYGISGSVNQVPFAFYNKLTKPAYTILYDQMFFLGNDGATSLPRVKPFDIKISGKRLKTCYYNNVGTTAGINHIYLAGISDSGAVTHPAIYYNYEINYVA